MKTPTCNELYDEIHGEPVHSKSDTSWRHGEYRTEVYHRKPDNTFWEVNYRRSTDGETNDFRDGEATIIEVESYKVEVTKYRKKNVES